jgi:hypothetical protein
MGFRYFGIYVAHVLNVFKVQLKLNEEIQRDVDKSGTNDESHQVSQKLQSFHPIAVIQANGLESTPETVRNVEPDQNTSDNVNDIVNRIIDE